MTKLVWDKVSSRVYQAGVDHGVLYLHDGRVAVWNGLINVEESSNSELKSFYLDGVKILENLTPSDFEGKLRAFTYPDEFDDVNGLVTVALGLEYHEQPPQSFNLSYRTRLGNDVEGVDYGYKIHILYNVFAKPEARSYGTLTNEGSTVTEFGWSLTGTPPTIDKFRPTVHITIDSTKTPSDVLKILEDILYGTKKMPPKLPDIRDIAEIFGYLGALIIIDNGDGSWTALDESDTYITMISDTEFQIDDADATYIDSERYLISSTNVGG